MICNINVHEVVILFIQVVHVSVQLFNNEIYAIRMSTERQLLTRIVISLYNMLSMNVIQSNMTCKYQAPFLAILFYTQSIIVSNWIIFLFMCLI